MSILKFIGKIISVLLLVAVSVCVLGSFISPAWFPYSSVVSILFPYIYIVLLSWTLVCLFLGWRAVLPCILGIVIGYQQMSCIYIPFWKGNGDTEAAHTGSKLLRILSWNVGSFSSSLADMTQEEVFEQLKKVVRRSNADIVCLQEAYVQRKSNKIEQLAKQLHYPYIRYGHFTSFGQTTYQGSIILSKFSFLHKNNLSEGTSLRNNLITATIRTPQATLRIFNVHLQSNQLSKKLLVKLQQLPQTQDQEVVYSASSKIAANSRIRLEQIKEINALCNLSKEPVIICADINDVAGSYNYSLIRQDRHDAFLDKGSGYRSTYFNKNNSLLGIDFIFIDPPISVCGYTQYEAAFSDHLPHLAEICIKKNAEK